ncbi:acetyl-CoA carboxylase biotin carboxyl carrier protein [Pseudopontixanthobacter vadosimaris]|uniref:acetyl-CoA carboxylase biotin carboxyl carrier protein n=1 Tax=Pseudopontixanthobacter vadosimaris TaxID=2726450 RepID=UPI001F0DB7A5|nr:acetyl-CoA carboxylase biotin carboxyl carrier protein [Pseudopontixanthobacter vadosimaris]
MAHDAEDKQASSNGAMTVDSALVRELAEMLGETGLTEIEVSDGERKIRVSRGSIAAAPVMHMAAAQAAPLASQPAAPQTQAASPDAGPDNAADAIRSPMVGTCYLAPEPESPNFVSIGDRVAAGDTLLIVEAMKVMNPITADRAGTVTAVLVDNAQPVEFDQPIVVIG